MWPWLCEDYNWKLEVVTVADADAEKGIDDSLVQIWKLAKILKLKLKPKFSQYFAADSWLGYEVEFWSRSWS